MPDKKQTISFNVPKAKPVEVHLVELADGRIVARTPDELEPRPAAPVDVLKEELKK